MTGLPVLSCLSPTMKVIWTGFSCPSCFLPPFSARSCSGAILRSFEQGILKKWKNILGVVSIDPEEAVTGLRIGYHLLREGRSLAIFPEGERSLSGSLQTFRPGTGYILSACPVPVIPCAIFGAFKAWPRHRKFPRPATIRLRIGPVIPADRIEGQSGNRITALLEESVRALLILG